MQPDGLSPHVGQPTKVGRGFVAFQVAAYRWFWGSSLFASSSGMLEQLAQGWLVLTVTNSAFWVGMAAGIRGIVTMVGGLPAGALTDRLDRRLLVVTGLGIHTFLVTVLGLLVATGRIELWHILLLAPLQGGILALQMPAKNTLIFDIVGRERLLNAVATAMVAMYITRVVSPIAGGLIIKFTGVSACYFLIAASNLAAIGLLLMVRLRPGVRSAREEAWWVNLTKGLRYVSRPGPVRSLLLLSLVSEGLGTPHMAMMPVMARDILGAGPDGLGYLIAAGGIGGLLGTLFLAGRRDIGHKGWLILVGIGGYGLFIVFFAASPWFFLSLAMVGAIWALAVFYDASQPTLLQTLAPEEMRGRVMGLFASTLSSSQVGGFHTGALAGLFGAPVAIGIGGALVFLNAVRLAFAGIGGVKVGRLGEALHREEIQR